MPSNPNSSSKTSSCFLCKGPHRAQDYPMREKLNALIAEKEDHNAAGETYRINTLQLLNAITIAPESVQPGLMHVLAKVNGNAVLAMMDMGATNNFVAVEMTDSGLEIA